MEFRTTPYWWETCAEPRGTHDEPAERADVVVIGSGYTGLSAAIEIARGGVSTIVIDAQKPGWGCSTRNGGQISTSVKPDFDQLAATYDKTRARAILQEGHDALEWIKQFVARENLDCDFKVPGRFHAAHSQRQFSKFAKLCDNQVAGLETDAYVVDRSQQRAELGTDVYHGGIVFPKHASVNPAKYHSGLLALSNSLGADLVMDCKALDIQRHSDGFSVETAKGTIKCSKVVVATNGYTGKITPWLRRRVIPIGSYVIATDPIEPELMDRLMPRDRIVSDSRKVVYYYRPCPERKRIIFGGRVSHNETDPSVSAPLLKRDLVAIFPELANHGLSHSWMGFVAYTFDTLMHVGNDNGLHYAMGYCGSGVGMASYLGMRMGQQVLGLEEGQTAFDHLPFPTRPLYYGTPWFLGASVAWYRFTDRFS